MRWQSETALQELDEVASYLEATPLTALDRGVIALAASVGSRVPEEICAAVHRSLTYGSGRTTVSTTAGGALSRGVWACEDYAHVMVSLCLLAGVPAR